MSVSSKYTRIDAARQLGALSFGARVICLAGHHGHVGHDGVCSRDTAIFMRARLRSRYGGLSLGPVRFSPLSEAHEGPLPIVAATAAQRDALAQLISGLREVSPGLLLGAELPSAPGDGGCLETASVVGLDWIESPLKSLMSAPVPGRRGREAGCALWAKVEVDPGMTREQITALRQDVAQVAASVDVLHVTLSPEVSEHLIGGSERASAKLAGVAAALVEETSLGVLVSGRVKHAEDAERALAYHAIDLVGVSRASLVAPDVIDRDRAGGTTLHCTGCMSCRFDADAPVAFGERKRCVLNFDARTLDELDAMAARGGAFYGVGASFGVLQLAYQAALRGVPATVHTLGGVLGGAMRLRGRIPRQAESAEAALQVARQCREAGVVLDDELTLDSLGDRPPRPEDKWVISMMRRRQWPVCLDGYEQERALDALALLATGVRSREPWVVVGDTLLAAEVALYLEMQALSVCLVADDIAADAHGMLRTFYRDRLLARRVYIASREALEVVDGRRVVVALPDLHGELVAGGFVAPNVVLATCAGGYAEDVRRFLAMRADVRELPDIYEPLALARGMAGFEL